MMLRRKPLSFQLIEHCFLDCAKLLLAGGFYVQRAERILVSLSDAPLLYFLRLSWVLSR